MTVRLFDKNEHQTWVQTGGGLEQARTRMTLAAWRLAELADQRGLAVHVWGSASTDIIGSLGHQLTIGHKQPEPGRNRLTRVRLCRHDGFSVVPRYTLTQARDWIEAQARPLHRVPVGAGAART